MSLITVRNGYETTDGLAARENLHRAFSAGGQNFRAWELQCLKWVIERSKIVVDVAAGRGSFWTNALTQRSIEWRKKTLIACDVSPAMTQVLAGLAPNRLLAVRCSMDDLPFKSESIDLLICHSALHYSTDPLQAINGFLKALSANGHVSIVVSGIGNMQELHDFFELGRYGVDLSERPLMRFNEVQMDALVQSISFPIEVATKVVWDSALRIDEAPPVVEYFASHPEVSAAKMFLEIRRDLLHRLNERLRADGSISVRRRQCHYLISR
ncbi:MAG: class I SAM-dependent methyltransferase [Hydrogenophaga sp.]|uniref:class I SAM-dependent methyltransferase n=1 Tax=Hydrogenophaga sp. TaxID=1904254 RepID=UPI001E087B85|nr:class I SAM-dependent methyltransferase [Hydrogenophaga sp.]MBX3609184.1 class I SAM-dependent methyltransferase [Hydrogenophaga sp.]